MGPVANDKIMCPCHGSGFDTSTGAVVNGPATRALAAKSVTDSGDSIIVSLTAAPARRVGSCRKRSWTGGAGSPADLASAAGEVPADPGVYRFRDKDGRVIYVGKAK